MSRAAQIATTVSAARVAGALGLGAVLWLVTLVFPTDLGNADKAPDIYLPPPPPDPTQQDAGGHRKERPSTEDKHDRGDARRKKQEDPTQDQPSRKHRPKRKRPKGWKGPWPPETDECMLLVPSPLLMVEPEPGRLLLYVPEMKARAA